MDVIADSVFNAVVTVRLRRRSEGPEVAAIGTVDQLLRNSGQLHISSLIPTAYRGFARDSIVDYLRRKGISSILIMPSHLTEYTHSFQPR